MGFRRSESVGASGRMDMAEAAPRGAEDADDEEEDFFEGPAPAPALENDGFGISALLRMKEGKMASRKRWDERK